MSELVYNCPRCNAHDVTFDIHAATFTGKHLGWQLRAEIFGVCRRCNKATVIVVREKHQDNVKNLERIGGFGGFRGNINDDFIIDGYISLKDRAGVEAPEHLPNDIEVMFNEGARCMAVDCFNAAGTMFRLCLDRATKSLLPAEDVNGLNNKIRRSLGFRMTWLLDNNLLPRALEDLATCVKEDGNDGAHEGTLTKADAEDLLDFTVAVLERLYTEPERLRLAAARRAERRQAAA